MSTASPHWPASRGAAALLLVGCALLWSSAGLLSRLLEASSPLATTFWRSFFCALTMTMILLIEHRAAALAAIARMGWVGLFSGLMWSVMFTCFMIAIMLTSVANTLLVIGMAPLLSAILARVVLGERISLATWVVIGIAAAGLWWMVREALSGEGLIGLAIAAGVPLASAVNLVTIRRTGARVDLAPAVWIGAILSSLALLPFLARDEWLPPTTDLLVLLLLGAFQLALPCWLMVRAARLLKPHEVALIALLEVVLGPLWAWLGAGELTPASTLQGGAVIVLALCANEWLRARQSSIGGRVA